MGAAKVSKLLMQWRNRGEGEAEGGSCPRAQQVRGAKQPGQKYFMIATTKLSLI